MKIKTFFLIVFTSAVFLVGMFLYQRAKFFDGKLHVVFCNVGQGDGIFIRTPYATDILIDAGGNDSILRCLSSHMPFWDRSIELAILTHPHLDHFAGFIDVIKRYSVKQFATEKLDNKTSSYNTLQELIVRKNIKQTFVYGGDKFRMPDGVVFSIAGPSQFFLQQTSPGGTIGESAEFASLVTNVTYGSFSVLFTGDSQVDGLREIRGVGEIDILQVPHHGSKTGLDDNVIDQLSPSVAVISVGKNKYGHPTAEVLHLLQSNGIKVLRTDQQGDIAIVSDGKNWSIR